MPQLTGLPKLRLVRVLSSQRRICLCAQALQSSHRHLVLVERHCTQALRSLLSGAGPALGCVREAPRWDTQPKELVISGVLGRFG